MSTTRIALSIILLLAGLAVPISLLYVISAGFQQDVTVGTVTTQGSLILAYGNTTIRAPIIRQPTVMPPGTLLLALSIGIIVFAVGVVVLVPLKIGRSK